MEIPVKRLRNGFAIPALGIGTWGFGGEWKHDPDNDDKANIEAIHKCLDMGLTHIDTAELYAEGYSEVLVGKAIKEYDRDKLFITTKISPHHLGYDDFIKAAKGSLKRMGLDYIDLYLVHYPNPNIPIKPAMEAMDWLINQGLLRNAGVSNFSIRQMKEAQDCSRHKIVVNQVQYNLIFREPELNGTVSYCQENDILIMAWKPIQKGMLSKSDIKIMDDICKKYGKTPPQISLNWLISQQNVVTITKMGNPAHIGENLGALGWKMDKEDIELLRKKFPGQKNYIETSLEKYPPYCL